MTLAFDAAAAGALDGRAVAALGGAAARAGGAVISSEATQSPATSAMRGLGGGAKVRLGWWGWCITSAIVSAGAVLSNH